MTRKLRVVLGSLAFAVLPQAPVHAQAPPREEQVRLREKLGLLNELTAQLKRRRGELIEKSSVRPSERLIADCDVYAKAAEWALRHDEFYKPSYVGHTHKALDAGLQRAKELVELWADAKTAGNPPSWARKSGGTIRGYYSKVDGSVQPYALSLPAGVDPQDGKRWPLYVKLHGRGATLNEVSFINRQGDQPLPEGQTWIQLDVFGRTNNAYRWAGETDVFEALDDVQRRFRIDDRRVTLWGFSMGGAGAWHLGLHHPAKWSSVGAGAGFVDFYKYQNHKEQLPPWQHATLHIYDAVDYALNAANVPVCTYGGELDKQLLASTEMVGAAKKHGVDVKLIVGKGAGHKFTPEGLREFMEFHQKHSEQGRPAYPGLRNVRFVTYTPKYNECGWLTVAGMLKQYEPAVVEGGVDDAGKLRLKTENVTALAIARDVATDVVLDGDLLPLNNAADGLLPDVYFEKNSDGWSVLTYDESKSQLDNPDNLKRRDLQGPIDDAFMQPFVCVRGTGEPWSAENHAWASWTLARFEREFDKWMRGRAPVVNDTDVDAELIRDRNLILFGDPGSNSVLARVLDRLPVEWTKDKIRIAGKTYDPASHGFSVIYPNPLNARKYVVVNSGHTFHEKDFKASNAWLFPRLGDVAVQKFERTDAGYKESIEWAANFNFGWGLPD